MTPDEAGVENDRDRREVRRTVEWLRESGERHTRSELVGALSADSPYRPRVVELAVQPALRTLNEAGLVEYRAGYHDYCWIGE